MDNIALQILVLGTGYGSGQLKANVLANLSGGLTVVAHIGIEDFLGNFNGTVSDFAGDVNSSGGHKRAACVLRGGQIEDSAAGAGNVNACGGTGYGSIVQTGSGGGKANLAGSACGQLVAGLDTGVCACLLSSFRSSQNGLGNSGLCFNSGLDAGSNAGNCGVLIFAVKVSDSVNGYLVTFFYCDFCGKVGTRACSKWNHQCEHHYCQYNSHDSFGCFHSLISPFYKFFKNII